MNEVMRRKTVLVIDPDPKVRHRLWVNKGSSEGKK